MSRCPAPPISVRARGFPTSVSWWWTALAARPLSTDPLDGTAAASVRRPFDAAMATLPSGRVLLATRDPGRVAIYDPASNRWTQAPRYFFPHPTDSGPNPPRVISAPGGALLVDQGLNRFSSAERFFEP